MRFMSFMVLILFSSVRVSASARITEEYAPVTANRRQITKLVAGAYSLPMQTGDDFGADEMRLNHYKCRIRVDL